MEETKNSNYYDRMVEVEKFVDDEKVYGNLTPKRKVSNLLRQLRIYCDKRNSASRYNSLEKKNPQYKARREDAEFDEMLSCARFRKIISILDDYEFDLLFIQLRSMLQEGAIEKDVNKRFKIYEYITTASTLIRVDNARVMSQMAQFKNDAFQLIKDIPTM